jgi:hypothetical protein
VRRIWLDYWVSGRGVSVLTVASGLWGAATCGAGERRGASRTDDEVGALAERRPELRLVFAVGRAACTPSLRARPSASERETATTSPASRIRGRGLTIEFMHPTGDL